MPSGLTMLNKRNLKFIIGSLIVLGTIAWLAVSGFNQGLTYYKTVDELKAMTPDAQGKRLRVAGTVVEGSIERASGTVKFNLEQAGEVLPVEYVGKDVLPDSFKGNAPALAEGRLLSNGTFEAAKIQAKCTSKYEVLAKNK